MGSLAITGASGFMGSRFGAFSRAKGVRVLGLSRSSVPSGSCDAHHRLVGFDSANSGEVDAAIRELAGVLSDNGVEVLVHLAAEFVAHHSTPAQAISLVDSNVRFGSAVLEACRLAGVKRMIAAGTAWQHYQGEPYRPVSLYAATREAFDSLARHYSETENLQVIRLHFYDSYGEGDSRRKLVSILKSHFQQCLAAVRQGASLPAPLALGPCENLINLLHFDDVVRAIDAAVSGAVPSTETYPLFAVRAAESVRVRRVVDDVSLIFRQHANVDLPLQIGALPGRPREMLKDWNFAPGIPGWTPLIGLSEGLRRYLLEGEA